MGDEWFYESRRNRRTSLNWMPLVMIALVVVNALVLSYYVGQANDNVAMLESMIESIRTAGQTTIVLVTHNVHQARRRADRVAMLLGGKMIEVAETSDFFQNPGDPRVGAFVRGEMVY